MNKEDNEKCTCEESYDEHTCPFKKEINDSNDTCSCCEYCTQQCAWDI